MGDTYVCANPIFHSRMKHIAIDFHFVRDQVSKKLLRVSHIHTSDQLVDSHKALTSPSVFKLSFQDGSSILRGHERKTC